MKKNTTVILMALLASLACMFSFTGCSSDNSPVSPAASEPSDTPYVGQVFCEDEDGFIRYYVITYVQPDGEDGYIVALTSPDTDGELGLDFVTAEDDTTKGGRDPRPIGWGSLKARFRSVPPKN